MSTTAQFCREGFDEVTEIHAFFKIAETQNSDLASLKMPLQKFPHAHLPTVASSVERQLGEVIEPLRTSGT